MSELGNKLARDPLQRFKQFCLQLDMGPSNKETGQDRQLLSKSGEKMANKAVR
jgi:hypothetical protein